VRASDAEPAPAWAHPGGGRRPASRRGRSIRARGLVGPLFVLPSGVMVAVLFAVPLVLTVYMSLSDWSLFGQHRFIGLDNYERMVEDTAFRRALGFTSVFTLLATALTCALGLALSLLVRSSRPGVRFFRTAYFLPVVIGMATASFLWIWLYNGQVGPLQPILAFLGLTDGDTVFLGTRSGALWSVTAMTVWKSAGFAMLVFLVGLQGIPAELEDAARVDGARRHELLRYITLPLLKPTFALVLVLLTTQNFLAFEQFFLMTRGGPQNTTITAVYSVYSAGFVRFQLGYAAALAVVLLVVLVSINAVQLRLVRGER
jgi:multiple sugar transport system permease protein